MCAGWDSDDDGGEVEKGVVCNNRENGPGVRMSTPRAQLPEEQRNSIHGLLWWLPVRLWERMSGGLVGFFRSHPPERNLGFPLPLVERELGATKFISPGRRRRRPMHSSF